MASITPLPLKCTSLTNLANKIQIAKCEKYFTENPSHFQTLKQILSRQHETLSLRKLEKLCNIDAYERNLYIKNGDKSFVAIRGIYENALQTYKKRRFDPFCRKGKNKENQISVTINNEILKTSIGQLNFFRMAFMNGLIDFAVKYYL
jgi:hypothetical protein